MPPEMWRGDISVHSDQYSLALTWYEMRTGRRVFTRQDADRDRAAASRPAQPDVSGVPAAEQKVLLRALAKKPDHAIPAARNSCRTSPPPFTRKCRRRARRAA